MNYYMSMKQRGASLQQTAERPEQAGKEKEMKKIMVANISSDGTKDINGNDVVFFYDEADEAPMGDEWDGNVSGYVDNYIDTCRDNTGEELHIVEGVSVRDVPYDSIVLSTDDGYPRWVFWAVDDDE